MEKHTDKKNKVSNGVQTRNAYDSGQVIHPLCNEFSL